MTLRNFSVRHPVAFSAAAVVSIWALGLVPLERAFEPLFGPYGADLAKEIVAQTLGTLAAVFLAAKIGLRGALGFARPTPLRTALLGWPVVALALLFMPEKLAPASYLAQTLATPLPWLMLLFLASVGFVEETLCRGLVGNVLLRKWGGTRRGIYFVALLSGALFGLIHVGNYFTSDYTVLASAKQIVVSFFFGVFFLALYLRTKSLVPGIVLHALVDLPAQLEKLSPGAELLPQSAIHHSTTPANFLVVVILTSPLLAIGLIMLRKVAPSTAVAPDALS